MRFLYVKNWEQFQQYKDRDPKWIKLHRDVLDDYDFDRLTEIQQLHLLKIWLLAAKLGNKIPYDADWVARKIGAQSKVDLKQLVTVGFLCLYESVRECTEAYTEKETEEEEERETEVEKPLSSSQKREPDRSAEVREVFDYWREVHDHARARLDDKRYRNIRARLSDGYTVDDLKTAIDGCLKSPHHQGENDRATVYDDIELICRSAKHVDQFIRFADGPDLTSMSQSARQTAIAAAEWITEGNA